MQRLVLLTAFFTTFVLAGAPRANAMVEISFIRKGEVPRECPKSLEPLLKEVLPLHGVSMYGFAHSHFTLYYRGNQRNLQELLDGLALVKDVNYVVKVDHSGKLGKIDGRKIFSLKRTLLYVYEVRVVQTHFPNAKNREKIEVKTNLWIRVFPAGGIEPDELVISANGKLEE